MDETEETFLGKFYFLLQGNLKREGNLKANSVLLSFLRTRSAIRYSLLRKSTVSAVSIPNVFLVSLLAKGLIKSVEKIDLYAITAKGVWVYEQKLGLIDEESLLTYINDTYFIPDMNNELTDKEKIILLTMIAARAFSENSAVDLKKSDASKDKWREVLGRSYDVLQSIGNLSTKFDKKEFLEKTGGNMHIVSGIFRHNNKMVQKTKEIYKYNGKEEYYLDLFKNGVFSQENLSYLFWQIFHGEISAGTIDQVLDFCNEVSSKENIYLFDMEKHIFSMPIYDTKLKDELMDSIMSRERWARI
jgi:hypothetical protein